MTATNTVHISMTGGFYKKYMKKMLFICFLLVNCGYKPPIGMPTKNNLMNKAPDGPPAFQYGWVQGCDTAASAWVSQFYSTTGLSKFQKDFKFADTTPDYELGWQLGYWYCVRLAEKQDGFSKAKYAGL